MATLVYSEATSANSSNTRFQLHGKSILIGAGAECAIRSGDPMLAEKQARLFERGGEYWIEDLGSQTGVFIGDKRVTESRVRFGEVIVVGSLMLRIDDGDDGDDGNDGNDDGKAKSPPLEPSQLLRMLAASAGRQKQLEEERNALGARVGELHEELAAAKKAPAQADTVLPSQTPSPASESTVPAGGSDAAGVEKLATELRAAEKARRNLEAKINKTQRKRAQTHSEVIAASKDTGGEDLSEIEIKQVQLLALNAQLAEADKSVERLRGQLQTRNKEIASLRAKAQLGAGAASAQPPRTTQPYAVPATPADPATEKKLSELKSRFETEFTRAVTLQRKLKSTETRLARLSEQQANDGELAGKLESASKENLELEKSLVAATKATETLEKELAIANSATADLETKLKSLKSENSALKTASKTTTAADELDKKKLADLKKLLEGAQREISGLRGKLTAAKAEAEKAAKRAEAFESEVGESAAKIIEQAEKLVELGAKLEEQTAAVATKDRELTDMAAAVAISAENADERDQLEKQRKSLQADLETVRAALRRSEEAAAGALAARRELEARAISAKSEADESLAKLSHADRRVEEAQKARERSETDLETAKKDLIEAREARLAAEEALAEKGASPNQDNTAVISLKRRISEGQEEAAAELDRLTNRLREVETDLDRALDAEQAALARADAEAAAVSAKVDRLTDERDRMTAARDSIAKQREELLRERDALGQERDALRESIEAAERGVEEAQARIDELEAAADKTEDGLVEDSESFTAPGKPPEQKDDTTELRERVVELASQNARLSSELSALREETEERGTRATKLEQALAAARNNLEETETQRKQLAANNDDLTRRYEAVSEKLSTAESVDASLESAPDIQPLLRECQELRDRVQELESQVDAKDAIEETSTSVHVDFDEIEEFTAPSGPAPQLIEWMNNLHEAIADLRKQMRAASDEAAMMTGEEESLDVVNGALSSAVARVETAREAMRQIADLIGLAP